jgi:predicted alpha-1,2-mannosidase
LRSTLRRHLIRSLVAVTGAALVALPLAGTASAATVTDPASLVNPLIGTSGAVDTFPGADAPFGMLQWSPDTSPDRTDGGGYEYDDSKLLGYSLTHISGPGCGAFGDVPILPTVGAIPTDPTDATDSFSHINEKADAGYYTVSQGSGVTAALTAATHSGIGTFEFPSTNQANLLIKVNGSADTVDGTTATVVSDHEVIGSVTAGHFCGQDSTVENDYTLHFDLVFNTPFTSYGTWTDDSSSATPATPDARAGKQATGPATTPFHASATPKLTVPTQVSPRLHDKKRSVTPKATTTGPGGVYLTFDATSQQTVTAKAGISFTSDANAAGNLSSEIPNWNFTKVHTAAHNAWNALLRKIAITGGSTAQQQQFYTALYHVLLHPNVFSDVNGQYLGMDGKVHQAASGHQQYANYSGWDIYRSQVQLAAMIAPKQTSDSIRSMLNDYDQSGMLPKWALANGESYVMVGDPADPIIADAYAFGARDFDTKHALAAMVAEAGKANNIRPGLDTLNAKGYLPYDATYGCCNFYGPVSTQLEYDSADYAIATYAKQLGDPSTYTTFATRAQNWQNVFNAGTGYMQAKLANGQFVPGFTPGTGTGFVEGTSSQYTPMVPFDLAGLVTAKGGTAAYNSYLDSLFTSIDSPGATNADLSNEPSVEIPWEYDFTGAPYRTQQVVRAAQQKLYFDAPVGQFGNDDLGAMSSWYVWSELGMYPETPGTDTLVLGSPVFTKAVVTLASGKTLTVAAPKASAQAMYVNGLTVNNKAWNKPWLSYADLTSGGTLTYDLSTIANQKWGADPSAVPPSDRTGERSALTSTDPGDGLIIAPGATGTTKVQVTNVSDQPLSVTWTASSDSGVSVAPTSGSFQVPARSTAGEPVTISAGDTEGRYTVSFAVSLADGTALPPAFTHVAVARPGEIWPFFTNAGISKDATKTTADFDGDGYSYSATALAGQGLTPGGTFTADGVSYQWPDTTDGQQDNIEAAGQTIPVVPPAGATKIGLVGSATNADATGAAGTLVVHYTDGSTQQIKVQLSDWTLGAGSYPPLPGDVTVATTPYRNATSGTPQKVTTYLFAFDGALTAGKTVASVTMPVPTAGFHVFSIGYGTS